MSLTTALTYALPHRLLSSMARSLAYSDDPRVSRWLIDTLTKRLPPEHVSLARWLLGQQAVAEGRKPQDLNRVDRSSNPAEAQMAGRLDAMRTLTGFERAIYSGLGRGGALCLRSIAWGDSLAEMMRTCSYGRGANREAVELVQLTMLTAQDHDDKRRVLLRPSAAVSENSTDTGEQP